MKRRTLLQVLAAFFTAPLVPEVVAEDDYDDEARFEWMRRLRDAGVKPEPITYEEMDAMMRQMLILESRARGWPV